MSVPEKILEEIEMLNEQERQKVLDKIKQKYMTPEAVLLGANYSWWDNQDDDIYNE